MHFTCALVNQIFLQTHTNTNTKCYKQNCFFYHPFIGKNAPEKYFLQLSPTWHFMLLIRYGCQLSGFFPFKGRIPRVLPRNTYLSACSLPAQVLNVDKRVPPIPNHYQRLTSQLCIYGIILLYSYNVLVIIIHQWCPGQTLPQSQY